MSKKISVKMYLDGASQFQSDIRNINSSLKLLNSEMKMNQEQFKNSQNSAEALTAKSETLNKQYEEAGKKVKAYADRLQEVAKARDAATKDYEKYTAELQKEEEKLQQIEKTQGKTSQAYTDQKAKVDELSSSVKQTSDVLQVLDTKEIQLQTSMNNATAEQLKYGAELQQTNRYLEEAEKNSDGCAKSIDQYGRNVSEADKNTEGLTRQLEKLAQNEALEKVGEGAKKLLENLIECAETAETFEYSIAKVQSIARGSEEDLGAMADEIRRVSVEMGYSANEVSEAVYQAISASVDASEAVGFVEDATKLARAGFTETTTAVDVLTTAINAYGKEANTTKHIADDLITTQNLGKTTVNELAQVMGTVIPTASALGVSLDQLSSMYVLLTKQGINTANATTYIRAMMNELSDSGSDLAGTLFELTNHSFGELMQMGYTVGDVMQILGESVDGDSESFKNLFSNVRAGLGGLSLFNQGADAFNKTLEKMGNNAGAAEEAFATMADTAVMTNERFKASVENLQIAVGQSLTPAIDKFKESGIEVLEWFTRIAEDNPQLIQAFAGAAAGAAALTVAVTGTAAAVAVLRLAFGDAVGAAQVFAALGVAAATGALVSLSVASEDAAKKINGSVEALKRSHEATNKTAQTSQASAEHARVLAARYEELADCADLTDAEFEELNNVITELNSTVPGLSLAYRENKNAVDEGTLALKENIDAMIEQMKYQSDLEELTALYKEQAEAEKALKEASNELTQAQADLAQKQYDLDHGFETSGEGTGDLERKVRKLTESQKEAQDIYDENKIKIDELSGSVEDYTKKAQEMAEAEQKEVESKEAQKKAQDDLKSSMAEASEAISKQIGLFDEWKKKSDLTLGDMKSRWEDQTKGVNQYSDDLAYLRNVIMDDTNPALQDLAQKMANMGMGGSAEIHNFVEGLKEIRQEKDQGALEELTKTWQEHIDAIEKAEGIYTSIKQEEKGYTEESDRLFTKFYSDSQKAREDYNKEMVTLSEDGVKDQVKAVQDNAPELEDATETMMNGSLQAARTTIGMSEEGGVSTVYQSMGKDIVNSIVDGFNGGDVTVGNALGNLLQSAADHVDVSGIADRINKQLGTELNRGLSR